MWDWLEKTKGDLRPASNDTSTNSATLEQSPKNSTEISPEERKMRAERQKRADERAQRGLARLNKIGELKAAEKAAKPNH